MAKGIYRRYVTKVNPNGGKDVVLANPMKRKANGAYVIRKFDPTSKIDLPYVGIREEQAEQARALLSGLPFPVSY